MAFHELRTLTVCALYYSVVTLCSGCCSRSSSTAVGSYCIFSWHRNSSLLQSGAALGGCCSEPGVVCKGCGEVEDCTSVVSQHREVALWPHPLLCCRSQRLCRLSCPGFVPVLNLLLLRDEHAEFLLLWAVVDYNVNTYFFNLNLKGMCLPWCALKSMNVRIHNGRFNWMYHWDVIREILSVLLSGKSYSQLSPRNGNTCKKEKVQFSENKDKHAAKNTSTESAAGSELISS